MFDTTSTAAQYLLFALYGEWALSTEGQGIQSRHILLERI